MDTIFNELNVSSDIQSIIMDFITDKQDELYWRDLYRERFSTNVLSKINPKDYFTKYILREIDQGWRLVNIGNFRYCCYCFDNNDYDEDDICMNCSMQEPCANCYIYNNSNIDFRYECNCSLNPMHVSWKQIRYFDDNWLKYEKYRDFLRSDEWKETLLEIGRVSQ